MTTERIKEIQEKTSYADSISVQQALLQVWNECEQERNQFINDEIDRRWPNKDEWDENKKLRGELYFYDWLKSKLKT